MLEIGNALHDARVRLDLELEDVARATRISARILSALETERFERIPGDFYARSYLRTYAEFLGLDSGRLVDKYRERFGELEAVSIPRRRRRSFSVPKRLLAVAVAAGAVLGLFLAFGSGTTPRPRPLVIAPTPRAVLQTPPRAHQSNVAAAPAKTRRPAAPTLSIVASGGNCWLLVRAGSPTGPVLYEATLPRGHSLTFARRFLWVRLGAPTNADVRVRGVLVGGLSTPAPTNLLVNPKGARPA